MLKQFFSKKITKDPPNEVKPCPHCGQSYYFNGRDFVMLQQASNGKVGYSPVETCHNRKCRKPLKEGKQ